jgi:hypothetical protein
MHRVRGDDCPGQIHPIQQWLERGDLVTLAVYLHLSRHRVVSVIHNGEQVDLATRHAATAQRLAVYRHRRTRSASGRHGRRRVHRPCGSQAAQPRSYCSIQGIGVDRGQHPTQRGLVRRDDHAGQRVRAHSQRLQDLRWGIRRPLADRRERFRSGQHRAHRHSQHANQLMAQPPPIAWIRQRGKVGQHA